jgi:polyhydroxybutyrate depolymerase
MMMNGLHRALALAAMLLCAGLAVNPHAHGAEFDLTIGDRRVLLIDPDNVRGPAPLVLLLHGGFGNAEQFRSSLPLDAQAARDGFRIAYLEGTGNRLIGGFARSWNAGTCCGPARKRGIDDVAHITAVIDALAARPGAAATSVSLVGHSNGAMMIYRYLCEGRRRIAAAVIISGAMMVQRCKVAGRPKVAVIHGANDPNVPVGGGKGSGPSGAVFTSVAHSVDALRRAGAEVTTRLLPDTGHKMRQMKKALPGGVSNFVAEALFRR